MFGRNHNNYPNSNPPPFNNRTVFSPHAFQQNQTYNNYSPNGPQFPHPRTNMIQTSIPNDSMQTNFAILEQFPQESDQYSENSLSYSSKMTFIHCINTYENIMWQFQKDPYPIDIDKMNVFITYRAKNGIVLNTLMSYLTGLSFYFRSNDLPKISKPAFKELTKKIPHHSQSF